GGIGMAQELLHLVLVDIEQAAVEHRVELAVEAEVEEDVPRVAALVACELADGLVEETLVLRPLHLGDGQVIPVLVAEAIGDAGAPDLVLERRAERGIGENRAIALLAF